MTASAASTWRHRIFNINNILPPPRGTYRVPATLARTSRMNAPHVHSASSRTCRAGSGVIARSAPHRGACGSLHCFITRLKAAAAKKTNQCEKQKSIVMACDINVKSSSAKGMNRRSPVRAFRAQTTSTCLRTRHSSTGAHTRRCCHAALRAAHARRYRANAYQQREYEKRKTSRCLISFALSYHRNDKWQ